MERMIKLNPCVSFKKKKGAYVFYIDFSFFFLEDVAAALMDKVFDAINSDSDLSDIPRDFIDYLISKKLIMEVKDA